jgi:putative cell wall-binding protein
MRKMKKTLALLAIVAMVLTMMPLQVFAADSTRLAGADRIATAIAIADAFGAADTVILAAADNANLVDSLAVAPLAGKVSPVYLTFKDSLNAAVKAKLSGKKVIAIGAISDAVVADAQTVATSVEKVSGADRLATNDLINAKLTAPAGTFVVGYNAIPDALSVASYAAANNYAIVLANPNGSVDSAKIKGAKTYIIGGPTLVSDIAGATRLFGSDRFDTNVEVVKALTFEYTKVYLANGVSLVDALAASSLAAKTNSAILLTDNVIVKAASTVSTKMNAASVVVALGGTAVVSNSVVSQVEYVSTTFEVVNVTVNDATHLKVVYSQKLDEGTAEDTDNYEIEDTDVKKAVMQPDGITVIVEIEENDAFTNDPDDDYTVKITDVENEDGDVVVAYKEILALYDNVKPEVDSIDLTDRDTLEITFTENVSEASAENESNIEILDEDDSSVNVTLERDADDHYVVLVTDLAELDEGEYTLSIKNVKDLAGNRIDAYEEEFDLEEDNTDPDVVSVKAVSVTTLKVTFDEPVRDTFDADIAALAPSTPTIEVVDGTNDKAYYLDFEASAPDEDTSYKIVISDYEDKSGNVGDDYTKFVKFKDVAPTLESTEGEIESIAGDKYAVFTFDVDVNGSIDLVNDLEDVIFIDEDGDEIVLDSIDNNDIYDSDDLDIDDNQFAIALANLDKGEYTVTLPEGFATVKGAQSEEVDVTFEVTTEEEADVNVDDIDTGADDTDNIYYVYFTDEVGSSALDVDNYELDGDAVFSKAAFTSTDKDAVKLTVRAGALDFADYEVLDTDFRLVIEGIQDTNGNDVEEWDSYEDGNYDAADDFRFYETTGPDVEDAVIEDLETITVYFDEDIANTGDIDEDDFKVTVDGDEVDIDSVTMVDAATWTLHLDDEIDPDYEKVRAGTSADFDGEDQYGNEGRTNRLITADI